MEQRLVLEIKSGIELCLEFAESYFHVFQTDFLGIGLAPFHLSVNTEGEGRQQEGVYVSARVA